MASRKKRGLIEVERVDPSNPNVIEVTFEQSKESDLPPPTKSRALPPVPRAEPIGDGDIDDVLFGGIDPRPHNASLDSMSGDWARDDANIVPGPPLPNVSFRRDAYHGTPFNIFNFEAMKRHIKRQVEWMTTDIATLIGGIQLHTGLPMDELILNGAFFNASAKDLKELHSTSSMGGHIIGPMLAQLAISLLSRGAAQGIRDDEEDDDEFVLTVEADENDQAEEILDIQEYRDDDNPSRNYVTVYNTKTGMQWFITPAEAAGVPVTILPNGGVGVNHEDLLQALKDKVRDKDVVVKKMGTMRDIWARDAGGGGGGNAFSGRGQRLGGVNSKIGAKLVEHGFHPQGAIHLIQRMRDTMQRIGDRGLFDRGGAPPPDNRSEEDKLMESVQHILAQFSQKPSATEQWLWNGLPENCGITAMQPKVRSAVLEAFENIRALPGKDHIKLIHLIRSPQVRTKFAHYVGLLMNGVPSMLATPSWRSGGGRISARLSQGGDVRRTTAIQTRQALMWFGGVDYSLDPNHADAAKQIYDANSTLTQSRKIFNDKVAELKVAKGAISAALDPIDWVLAYVIKFHKLEGRKAHNEFLKQGELEARLRERRETSSMYNAQDAKIRARTSEVKQATMVERVAAIRGSVSNSQKRLSRSLAAHLWSWLDLFGKPNWDAEMQILIANADFATAQAAAIAAKGVWENIGVVNLPNIDNLDNPAYETRGIYNFVPADSLLEDPIDFVKLDVALEIAKTETSQALKSASLWGGRWASTDAAALQKVVDLMAEVQFYARQVNKSTKEHVNATLLLSGLTEDDKVVLVKTGANTLTRRRVRRLQERGDIPLVAYGENMEGYFPQPITLLDTYQQAAMNLRPRGTQMYRN